MVKPNILKMIITMQVKQNFTSVRSFRPDFRNATPSFHINTLSIESNYSTYRVQLAFLFTYFISQRTMLKQFYKIPPVLFFIYKKYLSCKSHPRQGLHGQVSFPALNETAQYNTFYVFNLQTLI